MSVTRVDSYELRCDACNGLFETDFAIWLEAGQARDEAGGWDWVQVGEKDYCPDCGAPDGGEGVLPSHQSCNPIATP